MTGTEFRQTHGDPATWNDDQYEAYFAWTADQTPAPGHQPTRNPLDHPRSNACWFCSAPNPPTARTCGLCNHHTDDNPATTA